MCHRQRDRGSMGSGIFGNIGEEVETEYIESTNLRPDGERETITEIREIEEDNGRFSGSRGRPMYGNMNGRGGYRY